MFTQSEQDRIERYDEKKKKFYSNSAKITLLVSIISLGLFILLGTGLLFGLSTSNHNSIITRLGIEIESDFAKEQTDPYVINAHIIQYFNSEDDLIQVNYFEQNEKTHLMYVKELISRQKMLMIIFFIIGFISIMKMYILMRMSGSNTKEVTLNFIRIIQYSSLVAIVLWIIIFISYIPISSQAFDGAFTRMHEQLFPQANWEFSEESLLIRTYPQSFFHSLGLSMLRYSLLLITVLFVIATLALIAVQEDRIKLRRNNEENISRR